MATLNEIRDYGDSIFNDLRIVTGNKSSNPLNSIPPDLDQRLNQAIATLKNKAQETVSKASSGVKIGVLGEFSSGKTYLLSSLVGYGDFLPISANPTTGNITAIHLKQQEKSQTTKIANWQVEYLTQQGVMNCLTYMVDKAIERANKINISTDTIRNNKTNVNAIMQWCKATWNDNNKKTGLTELLYSIRELVIFITVYEAYAQSLCGKVFSLDAQTAQQGLELLKPKETLGTMEFEELIPQCRSLSQPPTQLDIELLKSSFPLIKKVDVEVQISPEIWDLSPLKGVTELILLDFPGLGAANSGVRDEYLSFQELDQVQTILILADARKPGSGGASQIVTMMKQNKQDQSLEDRILVGVSRFDELSLDQRTLDTLDNWIQDNTLLTEDMVLETVSTLLTNLTTAKDLNPGQHQNERIVFVSPLLGLEKMADIAQNIKIGSDNFSLDQRSLRSAKNIQDKWNKLACQLVDRDLKEKLAYFAEDGGITRLRTLILDHVVKHGLKQLLEDSYQPVKEIVKIQAQIKDILEEIKSSGQEIVVPPQVENLKKIIGNLVKIYDQFKKELEQKPLQTKRGVYVDQEVKNKLIAEIQEWQEWDTLFLIMNDDQGQIDQQNIEGNNVPVNSEDFFQPFETTLANLEKFARDEIIKSLTHNLNQLSVQVVNERENLRAIVPTENHEEIKLAITKFGQIYVESFEKLIASAFLGYTVDQLLQLIIDKTEAINNNALVTKKPQDVFPLLRNKELDWCPNVANNRHYRNEGIYHQMLVVRMRKEMIASANLYLSELIGEISKNVKKSLSNHLQNQIIVKVKRLQTKEPVLKAIAGSDLSQANQTPFWLEKLAKIVDIPSPTL